MRWKLLYTVLPVLVILDLLAHHEPKVYPVFMALAMNLLAALGLCLSARAARHPRLTAPARRPWRYLCLFLVLSVVSGAFLGVAMRDGRLVDGGSMLVAGMIGRMVAIPVLLLALLSFATTPIDRRDRWKLTLDVITAVGGAAQLIWFLLLSPVLVGRHDLPATGLIVTVVFPVGDLVLVVGAATVLLRGGLGRSRRPLVLLLAAVASYLAADSLLIYVVLHRSSQVPVAFDLLIMAPPFLISAAAMEQCRQAAEPIQTADEERPLRPNSFIPSLALVGGFGVLLAAALKAGPFPWLGIAAGGLVMTCSVAIRQLITLRENHSLLVTDNLTALPNRRQLRRSTARAARRAAQDGVVSAVLLIDLDGFKKVNDTYGHEAGDRFLVAFAEVLGRHAGASGTPARLGGDEFAAVLHDVHGPEEAEAVARAIIAEARECRPLPGQDLGIRCSIGIAMARPGEVADASELLRQADTAMYIAKRRGDHGWVCYSGENDEPLHAATVRYRCLVDLPTGALMAFQARSPRGSAGWPVLEEACRQLRGWQTRQPAAARLRMSISLTSGDLQRPDLASDLREMLNRHELRGDQLIVGLPLGAVTELRPSLRAQGIGTTVNAPVTMDDLLALQIDVLQLDKPVGGGSTPAILALGSALGIEIMAASGEAITADRAEELIDAAQVAVSGRK